jgi:hypothetical protein
VLILSPRYLNGYDNELMIGRVEVCQTASEPRYQGTTSRYSAIHIGLASWYLSLIVLANLDVKGFVKEVLSEGILDPLLRYSISDHY